MFGLKILSFFKLILPSAFESTGISMLQSVRNIFNQIGVPMNLLRSLLHKLSDCHELRKHLSSKNFICPTITAFQFNNYPNDPYDVNVHVMVATGMTTKIIDPQTDFTSQAKKFDIESIGNPEDPENFQITDTKTDKVYTNSKKFRNCLY